MKFEIIFSINEMSIVKILGKDICYYLLQFVDTKDISSLIRVNKFFNWLVQKKYSHVTSWKQVKKEIGKGDYYALILAQKYKEFSLNYCLYAACRGGSLKLVKEMLKRGADDTLYGIYRACKGDNEEILDFIVEKEELCKRSLSEHWNYAIEGACIGGHENIIKKILEPCIDINYSALIDGAFMGNKIQFLKYNSGDIPIEHWDVALYGAAYNNSISLIQFALENGATDMQKALNGACYGNHLNLVKNLTSNYSYKWNWSDALYYACTKGHKNIINYIMDKYKYNVNFGLGGACYGGKLEIIEYMISKGAKNWSLALTNACRGRKFHIVKMICEEKKEYLIKGDIELCISLLYINEEIKKYLKSVLEKMEKYLKSVLEKMEK